MIIQEANMLTNRLSTHGMFSNNSSEVHENFSQLQNSEFDFTQYSQEMMCNSQQFSSGSEKNQSQTQLQGRRLFDRYMAGGGCNQLRTQSNNCSVKGSKNDNLQKQRPSTRPNYQQQLQLNKAKAKERDEKDTLESVVKTVKECTDQVNLRMDEVKIAIGKSVDMSDAKLSRVLDSVLDSINENYSKMITSVQERDERKTKLQVMEQELAMKDSKIEDLKKQIADSQNCSTRDIISSMKEIIDQHQNTTEQKLKQILDITSGQMKNQQELMKMQLEDKESKHVLQMHVENTFKKENDKLQARILKELLQLRDELDNHKDEIENFYKNQLNSVHTKQSRDFHNSIQAAFEKNGQKSQDHTQEMLCFQEKCMQEISQKHQRSMEGFIKAQLEEQQNKHFEMLKNIQERDNERRQEHQQKCFEYHESIPKKIQNQLDSMHKHHLEEMERIRKEFTNNNEINQGSNFVKPQINIDLSQEQSEKEARNSKMFLPFSRKTSFISPGVKPMSAWNSKMLFSKTNPSPVATVHPQPQEHREVKPVVLEDQQMSTNMTRPVAGQPSKGINQPQRRSMRLQESQNNSNSTTPAERDSEVLSSMRYQSSSTDTRNTCSGYCLRTNEMCNANSLKSHKRKIGKQQNETNSSQKHDKRCSTVYALEKPTESNNISNTYSHQNRNMVNLTDRKTENTTEVCTPFRKVNRRESFQNLEPMTKPSLPNSADVINYRELYSRDLAFGSSLRKETFAARKDYLGKQKHIAECMNDDSSSSRDSSPMSVTKIMIKRKVRCPSNRNIRNLPQETALSLKNQSQNSNSSVEDFLSSFETAYNESSESMKNPQGSKRKVFDFDTEITKITRSFHRQKKQKS